MTAEEVQELKRERKRIANKKYNEKTKEMRQQLNKAYYQKVKSCMSDCNSNKQPTHVHVEHNVPSIEEQIVTHLQTRQHNGRPVAQGTVKIDMNNFKKIRNACNNISLDDCLRDINYIKSISDSLKSISAKQSFFRTLNIIADWMALHRMITTDDQQEYRKLNVIHTHDNVENQTANQSKEYPSFRSYMKKVADNYSTDSKEFLLVKLYEELPGVRDGFNGATLNEIVGDHNCFLVDQQVKAKFILLKSKTMANGDHKTFILSIPTTQLLRAYVTKHNIQNGQPVFRGVSNTFTQMHKKLGFEDIGGTNAIRHMVLTDLLADENLTTEQRYEISKQFQHSIQMSKLYVRKIISEMEQD